MSSNKGARERACDFEGGLQTQETMILKWIDVHTKQSVERISVRLRASIMFPLIIIATFRINGILLKPFSWTH